MKAKSKIINIAIHHEGKLLLNIAEFELNLSHQDPSLPATYVPRKIPITKAHIVAVVNNKRVFGTFSNIMSFTLDEP